MMPQDKARLVDLNSCANRIVVPALRWLCCQQLPTGELPAYRRLREAVHCWPTPLYSVLSMGLLACADPQTSRLSRSLYEAIPGADRKLLTSTIVTLRWRLRGYIVSQQEVDGTWRLHGRQGHSSTDVVTTVFATAALLDDRGARLHDVRSMASNLQRTCAGNLISEAALCYLLANTGVDVHERAQQLLEQTTEQGIARLAVCWILASCLAEVHSPSAASFREALIAEALMCSEISLQNSPLAQLLSTQTLLHLHYRGEKLEGLLSSLLLSSIPPWQWPPEPLLGDTFCPAFGVALLVNVLAQSLDGGIFTC